VEEGDSDEEEVKESFKKGSAKVSLQKAESSKS